MRHDDPTGSGHSTPLIAVADRSAGWLVPVVYGFCGLAFIADLIRVDTLAYGIFYIPLVATAVFHRQRHGLWVVTAIACLLVVIGAFFPVADPDLPYLIGNRVLSILAILSTAAFVHHARAAQERLAAQTRRAKDAEQIKTEIFSSLSQEMRTPLHALLGLLNLMMASCRPDQLEALGRVRSGGKQLLDAIDNLIDLTQIVDRPLRRQEVDLVTLLHEAADSARGAADEYDVAIRVTPVAQGDAIAIADFRATRRILDNLITHAIRLARPDSAVCLAVDRDADTVTASVSNAGPEPAAGTAAHPVGDISSGAALPANGGTGLTLSERLAQAMDGRLTVIEREGLGAMLSLSLPAA